MDNWFKNLKVSGKLMISFIIVLLVSIGVSSFALVNMISINRTYQETLDITTTRIGYIFEARAILAESRLLLLEFYYPSTTKDDIRRLNSALDLHIDNLEIGLNELYEVASPAVQERIENVLPLVNRYRVDVASIVGRLLNSGTISIDNPDFRTGLLRAEQISKSIDAEYGTEMTETINELSDLALGVVKDLAAENSMKAEQAWFFTIVLCVAMATFVIVFGVYISGLISRPLTVLARFMKKAGTTGDIKPGHEDLAVIKRVSHQKDEIGQTVSGSVSFVNHVTKIAEEMEAVAGGDLTADIKPLSENDVMGQSLKHMIEGLNFMFEEVNVASTQMSMGSKHVAYGAQTLAQNSSEQAGSVESLSKAISDIAKKTEYNFSVAEETSALSDVIKENAVKGAGQMDELTAAVREINNASQSIGRIMNAIDDISFQTNLLALNAAVEAARAGQHGRGFAIVAEEVRKLALRSADAAKETGELIQNSIEKAELGAKISTETVITFSEIVNGIKESDNLVEKINSSSEEQLQGISQINAGIEQVARVVQQNSATAEESAAASEEMSTQASILQELMTRFKIKEKKQIN